MDDGHEEVRPVKIRIWDNAIHDFFAELKNYKLHFVTEIKFTLEDYFMDFYDRKKSVEEGKAGMEHGLH